MTLRIRLSQLRAALYFCLGMGRFQHHSQGAPLPHPDENPVEAILIRVKKKSPKSEEEKEKKRGRRRWGGEGL